MNSMWLHPLIFAGAIGLHAADVSGDASLVTAGQTVSQRPLNSFQILNQRQVLDGNRTVILNRVAPPVLPNIATQPAATVFSSEAKRLLRERAKKQHTGLALGATVYDRRVTELHLYGEGKSFIVWSNIDFNDFAGMSGFETEDMDCSLLVAIGNESSERLAEANRNINARSLPKSLIKTLPMAERFSQGHASYFFVGENAAESCDPKTLAAPPPCSPPRARRTASTASNL